MASASGLRVERPLAFTAPKGVQSQASGGGGSGGRSWVWSPCLTLRVRPPRFLCGISSVLSPVRPQAPHRRPASRSREALCPGSSSEVPGAGRPAAAAEEWSWAWGGLPTALLCAPVVEGLEPHGSFDCPTS